MNKSVSGDDHLVCLRFFAALFGITVALCEYFFIIKLLAIAFCGETSYNDSIYIYAHFRSIFGRNRWRLWN